MNESLQRLPPPEERKIVTFCVQTGPDIHTPRWYAKIHFLPEDHAIILRAVWFWCLLFGRWDIYEKMNIFDK